MKKSLLYAMAAVIVAASCLPALADDSTTEAILRRLEAKIDALAKDNAALRVKLNQVEGTRVASVAPANRTARDASPPSQLPKNVYAAATPIVAAPVFSWTGCYLGAHAGGGWQVSSFTSTGDDSSGVGAVGGGQVGCNKQWNQFVIGVEGEIWASSLYDRSASQSSSVTLTPSARTTSSSSSLENSRNQWDAAVSVRSGIAFDRALIYGKLGAVWGKFDYNSGFSNFVETVSLGGGAGNVTTLQTSAQSASKTYPGVLIGVGFEYALTNYWTTKFEYNHIDFGNRLVTFNNGVSCTQDGCAPFTQSITIKERKEIAKVGLNYKFY
jgi:outer membrane immunogenic protein